MTAPIYLDNNGTTPHDPAVIEAMRPFLETEFGNPSSSHWYGIKSKKAVKKARSQVAKVLSCKPEEILFTSGGTESNNHAIRGIAHTYKNKGNHIITCSIEHPAVTEVCRYLEKDGFSITYLPVDQYGMVNTEDIKEAIRPETILITIIHANNEVGTIQPIAEISDIAKENGIIMHTDAAQSIGKIPSDVNTLGVNLLSMAGHKVYGPKGIGALYIKNKIELEKLFHGADQESGLRAGTENVLEIVGFGKACEIAADNLDKNMKHMKELTDGLFQGLANQIHSIRLNGHMEKCLPNTLSLSFKNLEANRILEEIGLEVAASAGAACHSDTVEISHVLKAMNVPLEWAMGTIRFSVGRMNTMSEIEKTIQVVTDAVLMLRV